MKKLLNGYMVSVFIIFLLLCGVNGAYANEIEEVHLKVGEERKIYCTTNNYYGSSIGKVPGSEFWTNENRQYISMTTGPDMYAPYMILKALKENPYGDKKPFVITYCYTRYETGQIEERDYHIFITKASTGGSGGNTGGTVVSQESSDNIQPLTYSPVHGYINAKNYSFHLNSAPEALTAEVEIVPTESGDSVTGSVTLTWPVSWMDKKSNIRMEYFYQLYVYKDGEWTKLKELGPYLECSGYQTMTYEFPESFPPGDYVFGVGFQYKDTQRTTNFITYSYYIRTTQVSFSAPKKEGASDQVPAVENTDSVTSKDAQTADKKAAGTASVTISALKAADAITLADKTAVTAARAAYDKLTDAQKKLVPADTLKKLTDAEAKIAALEKAKKGSEKAAKAVVKGKTYTVKTLRYKVTRADMKGRGTVTLTGTTKKKTKLTKLTVPKTVKIYGAVFKVTAIGNKAFNKFTKIRTVTIGDNVRTIGASAFAGNTNLAKVMIGKGVTRIGVSAFSGDKKLKTITVKSTKLKSVGKNAIKGIYAKAVIKVPKKQLKKYKKLFSAKTGFKKSMTIR